MHDGEGDNHDLVEGVEDENGIFGLDNSIAKWQGGPNARLVESAGLSPSLRE